MSAHVERLMLDLVAAVREEVGALPVGVLTLGEELRLARKAAQLSLQEVADRSGFTKSHVWEIEQGRSRNPTVAVIAGLSKGLGVPFLRLAQAALNSTRPPATPAAAVLAGEAGLTPRSAPDEPEHSIKTGGQS